MLPQKFKDMFGIKDEKDMKMANNIWKMLDDMSSNDPEAYQKFIQKNLTEGLTDAKVEKQKKQKPYKIIPHEYMLLQMDAQLEQQYISSPETKDNKQHQFKQKLDMNINKQKWSDIRLKFANKIHIMLNICHSDRVKNPTSRSKGSQQIKQFNISMMKDIENLYYSLQGPFLENNTNQQEKIHIWYFCMIFSTSFIAAFQAVPNGRRIFLGICAAYFQERIKADRNPILFKVNTHSLYGKNLYYAIDKSTIQVNQNKKFKYGEHQKPCEYLLERQVDKKERHDIEKPQKKAQIKKSPQIILKPPLSEQPPKPQQLPHIIQPEKPQKKILIQVLDEKNNDDKKQDTKIPYEMKQTEEGYYFQFLVPGVQKIQQLDLEVSKNVLKLKCLIQKGQKEGKFVEIQLKKSIDQNRVKAKMKKKVHMLQVTLYYQN